MFTRDSGTVPGYSTLINFAAMTAKEDYMSLQRTIDYIQAWSLYRESASGTAGYGDGNEVAQANIDQMTSIGSGNRLEQIIEDSWDNKEHIGKGHAFPTASEIRKWSTEGSISGEADVNLLGMLLYLGLGSLSTSTPDGATSASDHLFTLLSAASGLQLPSTSMVAQDHAGIGYWLYGGLVVDKLTLKGGKDEYVQVDASLIGNGRRTQVTGWTTPSISNHTMLRDSASSFAFGTPGSPTSYSADIISWEVSLSNNHNKSIAFYPRGDAGLLDSSNPASGMVAGRMLYGNRQVDVKFTVLATGDQAKQLEQSNAATEVLITSSGDEIETGFNNSLTIQMKDTRFRAVRTGEQDGYLTFSVEPLVHMPSTGALSDMLSITLRNGTDSYGLLQS